LTITFVSVFLASTLFGTQFVSCADSIPEFSLQDVAASILVQSPVDNESYIGSVISLNVEIQFSSYTFTRNSGVIPYQNISCIYSLDGGEWKNASFSTVRITGDVKNPVREGYWYTIQCTYNAVVRGMPEGRHNINVTVMPEEVRASDSHSYNPYSRNATVTFVVRAAVGLLVLSPQNKTYDANNLPLELTVNKPASWISYSLDGQKNVTTTTNATLTGLSEGLHTLTVYANDTEGNMDTSEAINFSVAQTSTPTPSPTPSPSPIASDQPNPTQPVLDGMQPILWPWVIVVVVVGVMLVLGLLALKKTLRKKASP
jgi:hypothetical protein